MNPQDVPSPIDLRLMEDAVEWERTAMQRPFREDFFAAIVERLKRRGRPELSILELGSGPGFFAAYLLTALPKARISLLDFSSAMQELAGKRLAPFGERVRFIHRNFKEPGWSDGLGTYDAVVTIQAVHELRHKRYAEALHRHVKGLLDEHGCYLVCDHYFGEDGQQNDQLYMSRAEQGTCLASAGYDVAEVMIRGGRSLYECRPTTGDSGSGAMA